MTNAEQITKNLLLAGDGQPQEDYIPALITAAASALAQHAGADMDRLATSLLTFFNLLQDEAGLRVKANRNIN